MAMLVIARWYLLQHLTKTSLKTSLRESDVAPIYIYIFAKYFLRRTRDGTPPKWLLPRVDGEQLLARKDWSPWVPWGSHQGESTIFFPEKIRWFLPNKKLTHWGWFIHNKFIYVYIILPYMLILELDGETSVYNKWRPIFSAKQKPCVLLWRPIPINKQICFRHVDPMWKPTPSYQYRGVAAEMHENPKIQSLTRKKA